MSIPSTSVPSPDAVRAVPAAAAVRGDERVAALRGEAMARVDAAVPKTLAIAVRQINESMVQQAVAVRFELDVEAERVVVKVVDRDSGELIRQIPSEEVLRVAKALGKAQGVLVAQQA